MEWFTNKINKDNCIVLSSMLVSLHHIMNIINKIINKIKNKNKFNNNNNKLINNNKIN